MYMFLIQEQSVLAKPPFQKDCMQCRMCPNAQELLYSKTWHRYLGSTIACLPHISA